MCIFCEYNRKNMILRQIQTLVNQKIGQGKAILITGPRQTGKTTLLKQIFTDHKDVLWLNGDDPETRIQLEDVTVTKWKRIIGSKTTLVLDEAQRIKNIGLKLKLITDQIPHVQVVATGSSAFELANEINEPLTGRKWSFHLFPVSYSELENHYGFLDVQKTLGERLVFGSYPEVVTAEYDQRDVLNQLTDSFLYKDILMWDRVKKPEKLTKLLQALSFQVGSEVSYNELGKTVGLDNQTVENYLSILEQTFVIFRLPPLSRNLRKELKKKRKIYFYDNGIRNAVIAQYQPLELRQDVGALWENWLISERKKWLHYNQVYANSFFWRTVDQQEIDYVEESDGRMTALEFKWNPKKKKNMPKAFAKAYPTSQWQIISPANYYEWLE
jgi:uncharacterized protein